MSDVRGGRRRANRGPVLNPAPIKASRSRRFENEHGADALWVLPTFNDQKYRECLTFNILAETQRFLTNSELRLAMILIKRGAQR